MSDLANKIRKIRTDKDMTQDNLAEVLHVTRQTVSSWETGRSEPSLEMLSKISEALGVGLDELLPLKSYEKGQKRYKVMAVLSGITSLAGFALKICLEPALVLEQQRHYNSKPLFIFRYAAVPLFAAAFAVFLLSLFALGRNVSLSGKSKKILLIAGIALTLPWLVTAIPIMLFDLDGMKLLIPWEFLIMETRFIYTLLIPFLSGICLFLAFNHKYDTKS